MEICQESSLVHSVMRKYPATLVKVVDGDTIDATIDIGFDIFIKKRIRLRGINAPETRSKDKEEAKRGKKTKRRLKEILDLSDGKFEVTLHGRGKFGRYLGEIFVEQHEKSVNSMLINEGLAKEYK